MENESKGRLLNAAIQLFAEHGYEGVSIRRLAETAGVNSALISYHFHGKNGLYRSILEKQAHKIQTFIETFESGQHSPRVTIEHYTLLIFGIHQGSPSFAKILCRELLNQSAPFTEIVQEKIKTLYAILRDALRRGVEEKQFRSDLKLDQTVVLLAGTVNFYFLSRPINSQVVAQEQHFADEYLSEVLRIFFTGIERRESP